MYLPPFLFRFPLLVTISIFAWPQDERRDPDANPGLRIGWRVVLVQVRPKYSGWNPVGQMIQAANAQGYYARIPLRGRQEGEGYGPRSG